MAGACGDEKIEKGSEGKLKVVTTVAPITSIAANVAGDMADIEGVVPEGTNSHTFEPAPSVAEVLSKADLITLARNSFTGSFLEPTEIAARVAAVDAFAEATAA